MQQQQQHKLADMPPKYKRFDLKACSSAERNSCAQKYHSKLFFSMKRNVLDGVLKLFYAV